MYEDYSNNEVVSESLDISCGLLKQVCYNFSSLGESSKKMPIVQQVPNNVWTDNEAESVKVIAYKSSGSEEYGICTISKEEISKEVYIE